MQNKVIKLLATFILLFSLQGFSQTTENSKHPKLDAYYSQKQTTDTSKAITTPPAPVNETKPPPAVITTPAINKPAATVRVPVQKPVTETKTAPVVTTTPVVNKPTTAVQKKVQIKPASTTPYIDTRLGSSSKLYDTYEKNNNGEGAVTANPK